VFAATEQMQTRSRFASSRLHQRHHQAVLLVSSEMFQYHLLLAQLYCPAMLVILWTMEQMMEQTMEQLQLAEQLTTPPMPAILKNNHHFMSIFFHSICSFIFTNNTQVRMVAAVDDIWKQKWWYWIAYNWGKFELMTTNVKI